MSALPSLHGIDPELLNAAISAETCSLLTAFALAVADTHPEPERLAAAFDRHLTTGRDAARDVPGRDDPAAAYAKHLSHQIALVIMKILLRR